MSAEITSVQAKAHAWGLSKTLYEKEKGTRSDLSSFDLTFSGMDSISGYSVKRSGYTPEEYQASMEEATRHMVRGVHLEERVKEIVRGLDLTEEGTKRSDCEAACERGLVLEVILLPYTGLREYQSLKAKYGVEVTELG